MTESSENNKKIIRLGQRHMLYDAALIEYVDETLFFPASDLIDEQATATGRAHAVFYHYNGIDLVLKHYHRGGKVANLLGDRYFGLSPQRSRSFREWQLLYTMRALDLPVPAPVAASVVTSGLIYRADLITRQINNASTLADLCLQSPLSDEQWQAIGQCVRRFHDHDVYHADLNARNILLDSDKKVWLLDFDKSSIRIMGNSWKHANLARLHRSLTKFKSFQESFNFEQNNWDQLLVGYSNV